MNYDTIIFDEISDITIDNNMWSSVYSSVVDQISTVSIPSSTFTATSWNHVPYPTIDYNNDSIGWTSTLFCEPKEFVDYMPNMSTVKEMCEVYPGFKKAFEHFKDVYDLVKDDFNSRKNQNE